MKKNIIPIIFIIIALSVISTVQVVSKYYEDKLAPYQSRINFLEEENTSLKHQLARQKNIEAVIREENVILKEIIEAQQDTMDDLRSRQLYLEDSLHVLKVRMSYLYSEKDTLLLKLTYTLSNLEEVVARNVFLGNELEGVYMEKEFNRRTVKFEFGSIIAICIPIAALLAHLWGKRRCNWYL